MVVVNRHKHITEASEETFLPRLLSYVAYVITVRVVIPRADLPTGGWLRRLWQCRRVCGASF